MAYTLLSIAFLHWVALITPGPNTLVVSNLAATGSRRTAICAALGVTVVAGIWSTLAALGINAIFTAHQILRMIVQIAGGCYLLYLGLLFWRTSAMGSKSSQLQLSPFAAFRMGFLTNFMNPKSVLFFSSVFATAIPSNPSDTLVASVIAMAIVNAFVWHMMLAMAFSHRRVQAAYARGRRTIGRTAGVLVGAFGLRLLITAAAHCRPR
jgi:threonine efflux protein